MGQNAVRDNTQDLDVVSAIVTPLYHSDGTSSVTAQCLSVFSVKEFSTRIYNNSIDEPHGSFAKRHHAERRHAIMHDTGT